MRIASFISIFKGFVFHFLLFFYLVYIMSKKTDTSEKTDTTENTDSSGGITDTFNIKGSSTGYIILGFILLWVLLGFIALIKSIICFGSDSTMSDKFIGLLIAFVLGPIYFIYSNVNKTYCSSRNASSFSTTNQSFIRQNTNMRQNTNTRQNVNNIKNNN